MRYNTTNGRKLIVISRDTPSHKELTIEEKAIQRVLGNIDNHIQLENAILQSHGIKQQEIDACAFEARKVGGGMNADCKIDPKHIMSEAEKRAKDLRTETELEISKILEDAKKAAGIDGLVKEMQHSSVPMSKKGRGVVSAGLAALIKSGKQKWKSGEGLYFSGESQPFQNPYAKQGSGFL